MQGGDRRDMQSGGEGVVGALRQIDMVVGMEQRLPSLGVAHVGDDLVAVHVGLGAAACLPDRQGKLFCQLPGPDGLAGGLNQLVPACVQGAQAVVGGGAGLLQDAKGVDQVRGHLLLSNGKVFKAPLGLGAPEFVRGNRDFTHGVMFYPLFQGGFLLFKRWGFLGRRPCGALPGPMDLLKNISKRMIADDDARPGIKDQGGGVDQDQLVSLVGLHQVGDGKLF